MFGWLRFLFSKQNCLNVMKRVSFNEIIFMLDLTYFYSHAFLCLSFIPCLSVSNGQLFSQIF